MINRLIDAQRGGIQFLRVCSFMQRRHCALGIARVTPLDILQNLRNVSTNSFLVQLVIAPLGTYLGARGEKDFKRRIGENHRAHIAPVGHQTRRLAHRALTCQERLAHRAERSHVRSVIAALFAAHGFSHIGTGEQDLFAGEGEIEFVRDLGECANVVKLRAGVARSKCCDAIDRAAIQVVETEALGEARGDGALA